MGQGERVPEKSYKQQAPSTKLQAPSTKRQARIPSSFKSFLNINPIN